MNQHFINGRYVAGQTGETLAKLNPATGEEFAKELTKLTGIPVRVTVASDYAAVIEALRNRTADLAFVHPVGYVLASREAKATIGNTQRKMG